jgi:hypothetical protein
VVTKRVLRYLQGVQGLWFKYSRVFSDKVILISFLDLNWGGNIETIRPIIGFTFLLANGVVSWMRKIKLMVACALMEAKYMVALSITK